MPRHMRDDYRRAPPCRQQRLLFFATRCRAMMLSPRQAPQDADAAADATMLMPLMPPRYATAASAAASAAAMRACLLAYATTPTSPPMFDDATIPA